MPEMKYRVSMAGDRYCVVPGDVLPVEDDEAYRLWRAGYATPADGKVPADWKKKAADEDKAVAEAAQAKAADPDADALK